MKNLTYAMALLVCGTAMAQEKPTEITKETAVKIVKYKDGDELKEGKIKVINKETSHVKLDAEDANKINQDRVPAETKVVKTVMIDNDKDKAYDLLTTETFYVNEDSSYRFSPDESGFMMALSDDQNEFVEIGKAWNTKSQGNYIVRGETYNGVGYFDKDGSFVVEYYDEDTESIKIMKYDEKKDAL